MKINRNAIIIALSMVIMFTMALSVGGVNAKNGMKIEVITDDDIKFNVYTEALTVGDLIDELIQNRELVLDSSLVIEPSEDTVLTQGMSVEIKTAKEYTLERNGAFSCVLSHETKVEDILTDVGIELGEGDYTIPPKQSFIDDGARIKIVNVEVKSEDKEVKVTPPTEYVPTEELFEGEEQVIEEGTEGLETVHVESILFDGEPLNNEITEKEVVEEAQPTVIETGTKEAPVVETPNGPVKYKYAITMEATAYDNSFASCGKHPGDPYYGITASGTEAGPGTVAIDPSVIPFGTKLYVESTDDVPSYGFATAEDTGGAIIGNRIDLWFESNELAMEFGRRPVTVYVLFDE